MSIALQFTQKKEKSALEGQGTIVIVERWLSLNARHVYWKRYLEKKGFSVHLMNFPLWEKDFQDSSNKLSKYMVDNNIDNAVLVGISSGAITCLLYLENQNGWGRVQRFITVGSPFRGTWLMLFLSFLISGRELLPGSNLMKKIKDIQLSYPEKVICVRAKFDEMVPSGSTLPGAHKTTINVYGHNNLHLMHKKTYSLIEHAA